jgi:hypothetical protein
MDETTFQHSLDPQQTEFEFSNRQFAWLPDSNNSSYANGQIVFDCASLANSGKFIDWSQSYLTIPLVLDVNLSAATTASVENVFAASLKNGYHQLINSLSVEITNNSVVNLCNFSNIKINYDLLSTCSREDELNFLPSLNFVKDTAESLIYRKDATSAGYGETNNIIAQTVFNPTSGWGKTAFTQNQGRLQRMVNTSFDPSTTLNALTSNYTSQTATTLAVKNYATQNTTDMVYYILATIPLKVIHDIFKKLPLTKGMYARIIVNTNSNCSATLASNAAGTVFVNHTSSTQNGVLPFMISPVSAAGTGGTGFAVSAAGATTITATMAIAKVSTFSHAITQARIYACLYEMSPIYEEKYFQMVPTKKILYNDILQFFSQGISPGGQVNQILTNGISRPRALLGVPFLSAQTNGTNDIRTNTFTAGTNITGTSVFSTMSSAFTSSPATCCPYHTCSNFNVLVSGVALYQSNYQYKFEHWLQEVRGSNALNGGLSLAMSSGLLSQTDYENGYGFIYVDLSRKTGQASDDISRSIQVQLTNTSSCYVDYVWFIIYEREITISTSTGALVI